MVHQPLFLGSHLLSLKIKIIIIIMSKKNDYARETVRVPSAAQPILNASCTCHAPSFHVASFCHNALMGKKYWKITHLFGCLAPKKLLQGEMVQGGAPQYPPSVTPHLPLTLPPHSRTLIPGTASFLYTIEMRKFINVAKRLNVISTPLCLVFAYSGKFGSL